MNQIIWDKNHKGKIRGSIREIIVYREEKGEMEIYSETNLNDPKIKFKLKPQNATPR